MTTYTYRETDTHFIVPAIRGLQGGKVFYSSNLPMRNIADMVPAVDQSKKTEDRAQRQLNKSRAKKIVTYIEENPKDYVLPALTLSLIKTGQRKTKFEPVAKGESFGELYIPKAHEILLNDGQHRHAAICEIGRAMHDTIALTIYDDIEVKQASQMFVDINQNAVKPAGSINTLFDSRDPWNALAVEVSKKAKILQGRTEYEKASVTGKSNKTFSLKTIVNFSQNLLPNTPSADSLDSNVNYLVSILDELCDNITPWKGITKTLYDQDELNSTKDEPSYAQIYRVSSLSVSALALETLSVYMREHMSQTFLKNTSSTEEERIKAACEGVQGINWDKDAPEWEGRCVRMGKIVKNKVSIILTSNRLLTEAGAAISFDNQVIENKFNG